MKIIALFLFMVMASASLCGCETVKGIGRDIEGTSSSVQKAISSKGR